MAQAATKAGIESMLEDLDIGPPQATGGSVSRAQSRPHIAAAVAARSSGTGSTAARAGRLNLTPGSGVAESTLTRNFQTLQQLWKQRDQITMDERYAVRLMNEDLQIRKSVSGTVSQATGSPSQASSTVRIDKPGRPPVANQTAPPAAAPGVTTSAVPREPSVTTITVEPATPLDNVAAVAVDNNGMPLDHNLTLRRRFYRHGDQDPVMAAAAALISEVPDDGTTTTGCPTGRRPQSDDEARAASPARSASPAPALVAAAVTSTPSPRGVSASASNHELRDRAFANQAVSNSSPVPPPGSLRRQGSGPALLSGTTAVNSADAATEAGIINIKRGSLQISLPADQFARSVVPVSPRSGSGTPRGSAPNSGPPSPRDTVSPSVSIDFSAHLRPRTSRPPLINTSDTQLASIEADIREWRNLFKTTYGYYPGVRDVSDDKLKKGMKKKLEMYRLVRTKNLMLQGKTR